MNHRASLTIGLPAFLLLLGGCIIVDGNTNQSTGGAGGVGGRDTTSTTSSSSSSSGVGGEGGAGSGGQAGAGVGGGGGGCLGPEDGVLDINACSALNTQSTGDVCGPMKNLPPPANGSCKRIFDIVQAGAFDVLATCLKGIAGDATNACDDAQVAACIEKMYQGACPSADAAASCTAYANSLCVMGETFDTQGCLIDTNPLNATGLQEIADCISSSPEPDCNKAFKGCVADLFSY